MKLLKDRTFIIFGEEYGRHPHSLEHIINELMPYNRILWVETIGMRLPRLNYHDFKRSLEIILKWIKRGKNRTKPVDRNLTIVSPVMLPFLGIPLIRQMNKVSVRRAIEKKLEKYGSEKPLLITSIPSTSDFVKLFNSSVSIYYCVDEFSLWPGLSHKLVAAMEKELIGKSDIVLATSSSLVEGKGKFMKSVELIPHGVHVNHFNLARKQSNDNNVIKVCYFGLIDERCDQTILSSLARNIPDCEINIFGEVTTDVSSLERHENIFFKGKVSYQMLPERIKDQDVFILPYVVNELTKNINPLKIREYLATGRPVISSPLPEVLKFKRYLSVAESPEDFVRLVGDIKVSGYSHGHEETINHLQKNESWNARAQKLSQIVFDYEMK